MHGDFEPVNKEEECDMLWGKGTVSAFACVIAYLEDLVFLLLESDKKLFRFPGGNVDPTSETFKDGVFREVVEEVGIVINTDSLQFVRGFLKDDETNDLGGHLMVFYSYDIQEGWRAASEQERIDVFKSKGDEVTLERRFVSAELDPKINRIKFSPETMVSPMHIIALRGWLRNQNRRRIDLSPIGAA